MENTSAKLTPKANPHAISIRLGSRTYGQVTGSRNHDLRLGRIPKYVRQDQSHLNDTLIKPATAPEFRDICEERRANRQVGKARRGLRSDAAVMRDGIITFGTQAQTVFEALDRETQNKAFTAVAEAIATRLKTTLNGLVVHRDETAIHAHFDLVAVNVDGHPISQANSQSDFSRLQDLAAEIIAQFAPQIQRGHKKYDRLKAGANFSDTVHRSVKQLHEDLPQEIETRKLALAKLNKNIAATEAKLAEETEDQARLQKRLATYQDRLARQTAELDELQATQKALH
ncbi:plasmid recombination protein [Devosia submarina]|uniref:plasmid recombination protein n=1 Tax=Devosia submarina TaxID=1173082 RepID=UPI000D36C9C4|nr:plasmid recombination protein [Devosia submarina]